MKSMWQGSWREFIALAMGLVAGYCVFGTREVSSPLANIAPAQAVAASTTIHWEYKTCTIDTVSLQTTLTALGADGWEVVSVTATDATVDTGYDGKSHLTTQRFEVTAKRKAMFAETSSFVARQS